MSETNPNLRPGWRITSSAATPTLEDVAEECPFDIRVNEETYAITLCSPQAQRELAMGLLFSEGHIDSASEILAWSQGIENGPHPVGTIHWGEATLHKSIASSRRGALNSACGACGKTEWEPPTPPRTNSRSLPRPVEMPFLESCISRMRQGQSQYGKTGGSHAAAAFDQAGNLVALYEDVGRHNAVDKVIGFLLSQSLIGKDAKSPEAIPWLLCVSGRIAYEIVGKAYRAGFRTLAAVGAPTSLAINHAEAYGMTLLGFCRERRATAYTHFAHTETK
jgi:FdhD protein